MYKFLKSIVRALIPQRLLFRIEPYFRSLLTIFYRGSNYQCPVCSTQLSRFVILPNQDKLCPSCGSISRNRRLWDILQNEYLSHNIRILDFSPSRNLYRKLKQQKNIEYVSSDLSGDFIAEKSYDITSIDSPEESYDVIVCYHILEHIEADRKAMSELFRVLKKGGTCLIQTPFKEGACYENPDIKSPEDRLHHFGQEDHVRIYSVEELTQRLTEAGFQVATRPFKEEPNNRFGFSENEVFLEARK